MQFHKRHAVTLEAKRLLSLNTNKFDDFDQLSVVHTALLFENMPDDSITELARIAGLPKKCIDSDVHAAVASISESPDWTKLTYGEKLSVIAEDMATNAKYLIRIERHGDSSKPGGLA